MNLAPFYLDCVDCEWMFNFYYIYKKNHILKRILALFNIKDI